MSGRFQPSRADGRSAAQVIVDHITKRAQDGDLHLNDAISHAELLAALGDEDASPAYYQAVSAATRLLQKKHGRSLRSERGKGYQFIAGTAQLDKARGQQEGALNRMETARTTVITIDEGTLSSEDVQLVRNVARGMTNVITVLNIQSEKLAEHDEDIARLKNDRLEDSARQRATSDELAEVKARLDELAAQIVPASGT
jgi:hypothetical protein